MTGVTIVMFHDCEGQSHKIVSIYTIFFFFEQKGEQKRNRTEALPA